MKYVKLSPGKCAGVFDCMAACAKATFKTDDTAFSSIRVTKKGDGTFDINVCNQCGQCIDVCPSQAIYRNNAGVVRINKDKCVGCMTCVAFCPIGAMHEHPSLDHPFKCISCGSCVKACPNAALEMAEGDFALSYTEKGQPGEPGTTFPKEHF